MIALDFLLGFALLASAPAQSTDAVEMRRLRSGALRGDAESAYQLGRAYKLGDRVPADNREAERWLANAARLGHAKGGAEYGLVLHQNGKPREALPWLREAATRGDPRAQYALGTLLFNGGPVPPDPAEARQWMNKAARAGLPAAIEALAVMKDPASLAPPKAGYQIVTIGPQTDGNDKARVSTQAQAGIALLGRWSVQLGAFKEPENARRYWRLVRDGTAQNAAFPIIDGLTRLRVGPFANAEQARRYCSKHRKLNRECVEVRSQEGL